MNFLYNLTNLNNLSNLKKKILENNKKDKVYLKQLVGKIKTLKNFNKNSIKKNDLSKNYFF